MAMQGVSVETVVLDRQIMHVAQQLAMSSQCCFSPPIKSF
jgi:hypothetical protein